MVGLPDALYRPRSNSGSIRYQSNLHVAAANYITAMFECTPPFADPLPSTGPANSSPAWCMPGSQSSALAIFIGRTLHHAQVPPSVALGALVYLTRLKQRFPASRGASGCRLFLAALVIAQKFLCDGPYSARTWVRIARGQYALAEVVRMERELLEFVGWELAVAETHLLSVQGVLQDYYLHPHPLDETESFVSPPSLPLSRSRSYPSILASDSALQAAPKRSLATSASLDALAHIRRREPDGPMGVSTVPFVYDSPLPQSASPVTAKSAPVGDRGGSSRQRSVPLQLTRSRSPVVGARAATQTHRRHRHRRSYHDPAADYMRLMTSSAPDLLSLSTLVPPTCVTPGRLTAAPSTTPATTPPAARPRLPSRSSSNLSLGAGSSPVNFSRPLRTPSPARGSSGCPSLADADDLAPLLSSSGSSLPSPAEVNRSRTPRAGSVGRKGGRSSAILGLFRGWRGSTFPATA